MPTRHKSLLKHALTDQIWDNLSIIWITSTINCTIWINKNLWVYIDIPRVDRGSLAKVLLLNECWLTHIERNDRIWISLFLKLQCKNSFRQGTNMYVKTIRWMFVGEAVYSHCAKEWIHRLLTNYKGGGNIS